MTAVALHIGYAEPLFMDGKPKWTDDGMLGGAADKTSLRYHDKERTLKILNGLCYDIFFRGNDIESPAFQQIPDCAAVIEGYVLNKRPVDYRKPLDSSYKKRTYTLSKELPAPLGRRPDRGGGGRRRRRR